MKLLHQTEANNIYAQEKYVQTNFSLRKKRKGATFSFSKEQKITSGQNHNRLKDLLSDQVASAAEAFKGQFWQPGLGAQQPYSHAHPSPLSTCPGPASRRAPSRACVHSAALPLCHPGIILCRKNLQTGNKKIIFPAAFASASEYKASPGGVQLWADNSRAQPRFTPCSSV